MISTIGTDTILITPTEKVQDEHRRIHSVLAQSDWRLHIRKPEMNVKAIQNYIGEIDPQFYNRITLHYHPDLVDSMGLGGVHFAAKQWDHYSQTSFPFTVSTSCHSFSEVYEANEADYVFFSPVYPSLSKSNYLPIYNHYQMTDFLEQNEELNIVALGGVTEVLKNNTLNMGFKGVAYLGDFWNNKTQ